MAAAPQEWIDHSLALLEQLESDREGLAQTLEDLERRADELRESMQEANARLEDLEDEDARLEDARKGVERRHAEIASRQAELWDRLIELQEEREHIKSEEQSLQRESAGLETREHNLPGLFEAAEHERRKVEQEIASSHRMRDEIAGELTRLDQEMQRMVAALEAVADAPTDDEETTTEAVQRPVRLVDGSKQAPPPPPPFASGKTMSMSMSMSNRPATAPSSTQPKMPPHLLPAAMRPSEPILQPASRVHPAFSQSHHAATLPAAAMSSNQFHWANGGAAPRNRAVGQMHASASMSSPSVTVSRPFINQPSQASGSWASASATFEVDDGYRPHGRGRGVLWTAITMTSLVLIVMGGYVAASSGLLPGAEPRVQAMEAAIVSSVDGTPIAAVVPSAWRERVVETVDASVRESDAVSDAVEAVAGPTEPPAKPEPPIVASTTPAPSATVVSPSGSTGTAVAVPTIAEQVKPDEQPKPVVAKLEHTAGDGTKPTTQASLSSDDAKADRDPKKEANKDVLAASDHEDKRAKAEPQPKTTAKTKRKKSKKTSRRDTRPATVEVAENPVQLVEAPKQIRKDKVQISKTRDPLAGI